MKINEKSRGNMATFNPTTFSDMELSTTIQTLGSRFNDIVSDNGEKGGPSVEFVVEDGYLCQIVAGIDSVDPIREATHIESSLYFAKKEFEQLLNQ